jgi:hypothetical protein
MVSHEPSAITRCCNQGVVCVFFGGGGERGRGGGVQQGGGVGVGVGGGWGAVCPCSLLLGPCGMMLFVHQAVIAVSNPI